MRWCADPNIGRSAYRPRWARGTGRTLWAYASKRRHQKSDGERREADTYEGNAHISLLFWRPQAAPRIQNVSSARNLATRVCIVDVVKGASSGVKRSGE